MTVNNETSIYKTKASFTLCWLLNNLPVYSKSAA